MNDPGLQELARHGYDPIDLVALALQAADLDLAPLSPVPPGLILLALSEEGFRGGTQPVVRDPVDQLRLVIRNPTGWVWRVDCPALHLGAERIERYSTYSAESPVAGDLEEITVVCRCRKGDAEATIHLVTILGAVRDHLLPELAERERRAGLAKGGASQLEEAPADVRDAAVLPLVQRALMSDEAFRTLLGWRPRLGPNPDPPVDLLSGEQLKSLKEGDWPFARRPPRPRNLR